MYIDSHAHLFRQDFGNELEDVIRRATDAGVDRIIVPGTNVNTSREALELAERYEFIYACVGIHPHEASNAADEQLRDIATLAEHPKVVAIGEIGLDYHYDFSPRERQKAILKDQILIAVQKGLPIVVHTRESLQDTLAVVDACMRECPAWRIDASNYRGVFHCFTGNVDEAKEVLSRRFLVSYPGIVTFKNSPVVETLRSVGAENILLETDAPYMAPVPLRGKKNEPAHLIYTARKTSEILGIRESELARITSANAVSLFHLGNTITRSPGEKQGAESVKPNAQ